MAGFILNVAIVLGVDAYAGGIPALRTAAGDARSVARRLEEKHGYTVTLLTDAEVTRNTLRTALGAPLSADDRLLLYFAGHGVALDGETGPEGFLLLHDAHEESRDTFFGMAELPRCWRGLSAGTCSWCSIAVSRARSAGRALATWGHCPG